MNRRSPFALGAFLLLCVSLLPSLLQGVSTTVVLSEFRTRGPLGGNDEFIELYNLSSSAVNIGGWEIHGSNNAAGGTLTPRATIPAGTMLNPGCHYLLTNSGSNGYSGSVPGNQTYGTGITDDGGIALTLPDDSIVDMVGMSAGSAFKEGTILAPLTTNVDRGYERKPGGAAGSGQDTDDNASDFQLLAPSDPQNLSSACIESGGPTDPSGVGAANPDSVEPGDSTLLTVAVTPGTNPTSTGLAVSADLTLIGGSATQSFFDDGTNGDVTGGDTTFSFSATVSMGTTPGAKSLPATITDAESRTGNTTISLSVAPPIAAIHTLQGSGNSSPFVGQLVRTTGIVTARRFNNGFFLQTPDAEADSDPNTSEGIFVFTSSAPPAAAAVGNLVSVTGTVAEFIPAADPFQPPLTEIAGSPAVTELSTGNPLPAPVTLTAADTSPAGAIEQLERFEGMRVHVSSLTVVAPTMGFISETNATGSSNGVFFGVITGVARPFREPGIHTLDPLPMGSPCCVPRWDGNPERLRVDSDGQVGALPPVDVTSGAVITDMVGVLDFGFRTYTVLPDPGGLTVTGLATATPVPTPAINEFTVASFNLNRFFDTVNDPAIGEPVLNAAGFDRRLSKVSLAIRDVLRSPDIIGLQEVENLSTLQAIADRLNTDTLAAGGSNPDYQAYLEEGNDVGGIDVGLLVKMSRVIVHDVTQEGKFATFINPVSGLPETLNDRPPLVLRATVLSPIGPDVPVTFIVNHLRSLLGVDDPADGPRVRAKRAAQAEFLADLVQQRQLADPDEHIVVVGDFNAFQFNDGYVDVVGTVTGNPTAADQVVVASSDLVDPNLANLVETTPADQRYSFVFDGNAQTLDHVLTTQNLVGRLSGLHFARFDADFPETYRSDAARPERLSDHDAPVAFFFLLPIEVTIDIKPGELPNSIKLGSRGNVPVAILSTPSFDARTIDPSSVELAGAGVKLKPNGLPMFSFQDVDGDGLLDLLVHVTTEALQLTDGDTVAILEGMTFDGKKVRGSDTVRIIP